MSRLLLEIGTEEIPAGYIEPALDALANNLRRYLTLARIGYEDVNTYGTPRRLVVSIDHVAERQKAVTDEVLGPPERIAFDDQGHATVPARKFAEKVGVGLGRLRVTETEKGRYLCATITDKGKATKTILRQILPEIILATPFPKTMRWSDLTIAFARPIQSILALLDHAVIPFSLGSRIKSSRYAWGHMFMQHQKLKIADAHSYIDRMRKAHVVVDIQVRKEMVRQQINAAAKAQGGRILPDDELLDIVTNLVEIPTATGGRFDDVFLELPREILITSMREHQKYFAVVDDAGELMPCFVAVNNTCPKDPALVAKGHERVLRARLSDAQFFYRSDLQERMDQWGEQLKGVMFQAKLGSMHAKVERVEKIVSHLADAAAPNLKPDVVRAAQLCKTDLVSQVVGEFAKLQGIMGRTYAAIAGESVEVATAIEEHYRPLHSGGSLPGSLAGALLAIADKLDTICACFSVGLIPTGASDPYALRRQGIGIVQIMLAHQLKFSLKQVIGTTVQLFDKAQDAGVIEGVYGFIRSRIGRMLADEGYDKDAIAAVVDVSVDHIPNVWQRVAALQELKGAADFEPLAAAFKRVVNILHKADARPSSSPDPALFQDAAETGLFAAYQKVHARVSTALAAGDFKGALQTVATLREPVDRFFEDVMVMADDAALQANRLALLAAIAAVFKDIADFSKITI
jgi:glycyl-tRNA synthetase beta chain